MLGTVPDPEPRRGEVLVEVQAVALSSWEREIGLDPDRAAVAKKAAARQVCLGLEFAGVLRTDGRRLRRGQRVIGGTDLLRQEKALAELVAVREDYLVELPDELTAAQGAVLPIGAGTALQLVAKARVTAGRSVLVVGANGGVGVYAVQLAAARGATVTAVAGRDAADGLRRLGAVTVLDYRDRPVTELTGPFDVVVELSDRWRRHQVKHLFGADGVLATANPQHDLGGLVASWFGPPRMPFVLVTHSTRELSARVLERVAAGDLTPMVESEHPVDDLGAAMHRLLTGSRFGKVVVTF